MLKYRLAREGLQLQAKETTVRTSCGKNSKLALYNCKNAKIEASNRVQPKYVRTHTTTHINPMHLVAYMGCTAVSDTSMTCT